MSELAAPDAAIKVKISQAARMIEYAIKARLVTMLKGSPGTGKSQVIHQIAAKHRLKVIDLRLSQCDPTDLAGFPTIIDGKADYVPMAHFPIVGDPIPDGYAGWMLFLDEANAAPPAIQAAAYKLVLDRMVGSHHLHPNVAMAMAGNLETDGAIVQPMSTALQSRLMHLELVVDAKEWVEWAEKNDFDYRLTGWVKFKPQSLYTFQADHTDCTYACPRTYEFANRLLNIVDTDSPDMPAMLSGIMGEGVARELQGFFKIHAGLLTPAQIQANPEKVQVPTQPSVLYALTGSVAHNMSMSTAEAYMKFVRRLPVEFQMVCLREALRRNLAMQKHEAVQKWVAENAEALF